MQGISSDVSARQPSRWPYSRANRWLEVAEGKRENTPREKYIML
jgi:hypothetical protein